METSKIVSEEQQPGQQPNKEPSARHAPVPALSSYKSYWPFTMAVALIVVLLGLITHPIVLGIGIVFATVAIIGWGLEHR